MKKRLLTVVISTREALEEAIQENDTVLYLMAEQFPGVHESIRSWMDSCGYSGVKAGCRGIFFVKTQGTNAVDPHGYELYDPFAVPSHL